MRSSSATHRFDSLAAGEFGVPFIRVPRSEDATFSFAQLISGPSRYRSGDFTAVMLDRYKPQGS